MISDKMLSHNGALKSPFKIYKIIYRILCPFVVLVGVFAAILALFPAKQGENARMNALIVFLVMAAAIGVSVFLNHAFEKNNAYSRYLPKFLEKINFSVVVPLAVMVIVTLLPFYILLITSVKTSAEANAVGFTWWPREGFEFGNYKFGIKKKYHKFAFVGFGKTESYVDKNVACEYGYYESSAKENYDMKFIRPQESGSHYASKYLYVKDLFTLTAEKPFSFSVNPYTTRQLYETTHNFDLPENDFVNVCVDLAMRGVGSHSCGPELDKKYEIPKEGKNVFKIVF